MKDSEKTVDEAITSIGAQDFPHELIEVIFVDDGSTDGTLSLLENLAPSIGISYKIFHHEWRGLGFSRNVVVKNAGGEYIVWVDGDMSLPADFVRRQVEFMDSHSEVGIAKGIYKLENTTSLVAYLQSVDELVKLLGSERKNSAEPLGTGGCIYRVKAIKEIGGFNEEITGAGEDIDAEYRISMNWQLEVTSAEFYEGRRNNWNDLWQEYYWHGTGARGIFNKIDPRSILIRMFPPLIFVAVISRSCKAYNLTRRKIVFLLPFVWIFKRAAWFIGFVKNA